MVAVAVIATVLWQIAKTLSGLRHRQAGTASKQLTFKGQG
jgi:hypothetical protein